jgi:hypothetical protein
VARRTFVRVWLNAARITNDPVGAVIADMRSDPDVPALFANVKEMRGYLHRKGRLPRSPGRRPRCLASLCVMAQTPSIPCYGQRRMARSRMAQSAAGRIAPTLNAPCPFFWPACERDTLATRIRNTLHLLVVVGD